MMSNSYLHWHCETDSNHILWLTLDREGQSVNSLSREVFNELDDILTQLHNDLPAGVVITSGKKTGFIAGADINQFTDLKTPEDAFALVRQAQLILDKLEALPVPTVAMINGFCLGGGTEVSLACDYRVALDDPKTVIGLPEVKLGIQPGWGGTVRLPRLIGASKAMSIILPGKALPARKAKKIGMVDDAVPLRELKRAATHYILHKPKRHKPSFWSGLSNSALVRPLLGRFMLKMLQKKRVNEEYYPAPYAIVRNWVKHGVGQAAYEAEANSIADLMMTSTARNLLRVFFLRDTMKALAKGCNVVPAHVHVIGAGTMGGDIASWCALQGMQVTLQDQSAEKIAPAIKRAYQLYKKKLKLPRLIQAVMDRLQPDVQGYGISKADIIIEAIFENLEVKQKVFQDIETRAKPEAILATNTSSIPLEDIGSVLRDPSRLVGTHFFNPVSMMPLVEIVHGEQTSDEIVKKAAKFVTKISRFPLSVKSRPGFLVNRILMPYLMEAMQLYQEGVPAVTIDKAALQFGMPMGPITLADKVGLDICLDVAKNLMQHFGGSVPDFLQQMVDNGKLGVKSGEGFYRYKNGKPQKTPEPKNMVRVPDIADRMIFRMLNEAVACLHEGVVSEADLVDAGMVYGTGFAPFRGGPIQYAKSRGVIQVVGELERFSREYGERFRPFAGWDEIR